MTTPNYRFTGQIEFFESGTDYYDPDDRVRIALIEENYYGPARTAAVIAARALDAQNIARHESPEQAAVRAGRAERNAAARREEGYE